jgi:hypothetical protein
MTQGAYGYYAMQASEPLTITQGRITSLLKKRIRKEEKFIATSS